MNPVVEATTVGFISSSKSKGLITIPPPIPNIPANVPAIKQAIEIVAAD